MMSQIPRWGIGAAQWGLRHILLVGVIIVGGLALWVERPLKVDLPEYPQAINLASYALTSREPRQQVIQSFATAESLDPVIAFYRQEIEARGWTCAIPTHAAAGLLACTRAPDAAWPCEELRPCYLETLTVAHHACSTATCMLVYIDSRRSRPDPD